MAYTFKSNGKLLLTGEYVVLDGAKALALPTTYGQSLTVFKHQSGKILWNSYDKHKNLWFQDTFNVTDNDLQSSTNDQNPISKRLIQILEAVRQLSTNFLTEGFSVKTELDFNWQWGLGTSSTLINNIAQWANINPYKLLELTFGGSGYDIACARHNTAIIFRLLNNNRITPHVTELNFNPSYKDHLYFIYLNKKQNSREAIATYKAHASKNKTVIAEINGITNALIEAKNLNEFNRLIDEHEAIIASIIKQDTVKKKRFKDFNGHIKSLGAWGGDFVLATSEDDPSSYFKEKGYHTVITYKDMIRY